MAIFGIDVGGTGIKAGLVEPSNGSLLNERVCVLTPRPANPESIAREIKKLCAQADWKGSVGVGFPAAIQRGKVRTAANIDPSFIGLDIDDYFSNYCQQTVHVINDADAAGLAEVRLGAGKDQRGVVLVITIGTGLGTALFSEGHLLPNSELGHVFLSNGQEAEKCASEAVRVSQNLSWQEWGGRFNDYLVMMEKLVWPDLIILGGGVSAKLSKYAPMMTIKTPVIAASFLNRAGIVGAALFAEEIARSEA